MGKSLDFLVRELDPRHDLDRHVKYKEFTGTVENFKENLKRGMLNTGIAAISLPKHILRGGVAGGVLGSAVAVSYSLATGLSPSEVFVDGAFLGGFCGATVDSVAYCVRYMLVDWAAVTNALKK